MKKNLISLIFAFMFAITSVALAAEDDYSRTIETFKRSPAVAKFFDNSYGYAVFPTIGKAGLVIGGSYGTGRVYQGGKVTGKTSVVEGSIGWQAGGKAFSEIIFFQDKRAYDEFTSGNFEFDATAQATAITAGAQATAGTSGMSAGASAGPRTGVQAEVDYVKGMATFVHTLAGLMYEISIGGQKFNFQPLQQQ